MNTKWSDLYRHFNYSKQNKDFIERMSKAYSEYEVLKDDTLISLGHDYRNFFEETITITKAFLQENMLFSYNTSDVIKHVLCTDILNNGITLYYIYRGMQNIEKNKFIIHKKYLSECYLKIFSELNMFFTQRIEKEKMYELAG